MTRAAAGEEKLIQYGCKEVAKMNIISQ